MIIPRVPLQSTKEQLAASLQKALASVQTGWRIEHTAEGTHDFTQGTSTLVDASGAGLTLTVPVCEWVRVGQIVLVGFRITYPSTASTTANFISGLPFTVASMAHNVWCQPLAVTTDTTNANTIVASSNNKGMIITNWGGTAATNAQLSTDTVQGTLMYRTSEG